MKTLQNSFWALFGPCLPRQTMRKKERKISDRLSKISQTLQSQSSLSTTFSFLRSLKQTRGYNYKQIRRLKVKQLNAITKNKKLEIIKDVTELNWAIS